jgi:hypothetical protein
MFTIRSVFLVGVLTAAVALLAFVGPASASVSYRCWCSDPADGPTDIIGERVAIGFPAANERNITYGDSELTSIWAANNLAGANGRGIQQGVTYSWGNSDFYGTCQNYGNNGSSPPASFNFEEIYDHGVYSCYYEEPASGGTAYTETLFQDSPQTKNWLPYVDITYGGHSISWTACGGNACQVKAAAEDVINWGHGTLWVGKFNGAIQPWQFYNGSLWGTIRTGATPVNANQWWTHNMSNFPDGLWWFKYYNTSNTTP